MRSTKPRLEDFPDGYAWAEAFAIWNHRAWVDSVAEACRTAHQPARWETALNCRAAEEYLPIPFLWTTPPCACKRAVPIPDTVPRIRWWP